MGDGHINRSATTPRLRAEMTNKKYLEYLDSKFPHIGNGVKISRTAKEQSDKHIATGFNPDAAEGNYSDCYWWETMCHHQFDSYADWYESGSKVFPENLNMTPTKLKHWYVCDGNLNGKYVRIYVGNERENKQKINSYFKHICTQSPDWSTVDRGSNSHTSINFNKEDSNRLMQYMGKPLPGFRYKWI